MPRGLQVVGPPLAEPLTLAEAKNWCRVDAGTDDHLILRSLRSARLLMENGWNRAFVSQTLRQSLDRFPRYSSSAVWQYNSDAIWQQRLPVTQLSGQWYPDRAAIRVTRPPFQQLLALTYQDGNGINQTLVNSLAAGVNAPGPQAVTPATMLGIVPGLPMVVDVGPTQETIFVSSVTATTFTATFLNVHPCYVALYVVPPGTTSVQLNGGGLVDVDASTEPARLAPAYGQIWPIVRQKVATVQVLFVAGYGPVTTIPLPVAPGLQSVTPASMYGIFPGTILAVDQGSAWEQVVVTAITPTTFTATFAQPHTAGALIMPALPDQLREAILMMVEHRYRNRGAVQMGNMNEVPLGMQAALDSGDCFEYE